MADEIEKKTQPEESPATNKEVDRNPDLAEATSGMVDLSDILGGDNPEESLAQISQEMNTEADAEEQEEEHDPLEDALNKAAELEPISSKDLPLRYRIKSKLFPIDSKQRNLVISIVLKSKAFSVRSKTIFSESKSFVQKVAKEDSKRILNSAKEKIGTVLSKVLIKLKSYWSLSWKLKLSFIGLLLLSFVLFVVLKRASQGNLLPEMKDAYISNFNERADFIYDIAEDANWEEFRNPLRFPEYIVKFERLIVVLKKSRHSSSSPMAVTSVYYEASSQEAAIEIKKRESEVRDISARTLEEMTYDQLRTAEGKSRAKVLLAQNINQHLNQGKIVKVYFKEFVAKP